MFSLGRSSVQQEYLPTHGRVWLCGVHSSCNSARRRWAAAGTWRGHRVGELGDILVQRLKSLELGLNGNESAALAVQLIDLHEAGLTSHQEINLAQRHQKAQLKLREQAARLG